MTENHAQTRVSIKLDYDELETVKQLAREQGFKTVSAWFRAVTGLDPRRPHVGKISPDEEEHRDKFE